MRQLIKKFIYLLLFFAFLALGWVLNKPGVVLHSNASTTRTLTELLHEKEWVADQLMDTLLSKIEDETFSEWVNTNSHIIDFYFKNQGIILYIYQANELVYWTNNSVAVPQDTFWLDKPFKRIGNVLAEVRTKNTNKAKSAALIQIMTDYPFENEFLKDEFHKSLAISNSFSLVVDEGSGNSAITNKEGAYLFSLKENSLVNFAQKENVISIVILIAAFFLLLFARDLFKNRKLSFAQFLLFSAFLIGVRVAMQGFRIPYFFDKLPLFQPETFAYSHFFPSLGDLMISVALLVSLIYIFYSKVNFKKIHEFKTITKYSILLLWIIFISAYLLLAHNIFKHLILDSNFQYEAYDVLNLSVFSFIGYFILIVLFAGFILLVDKFIYQTRSAIIPDSVLYYIAGITFLCAVFLLFFHGKEHLVSLLFIALVIIYWIVIRLKLHPGFGSMVILLALFASYSTYFIRKENYTKRIEESKVLAVNLAREQDPVAELVLSELIEKVKKDAVISSMLQKEWFNFNDMSNYIQSEYFTGYLGRYSFQLTLCNSKDSVLLDAPTQEWEYCFGFFQEMIKQNGTPTNVPGLYYLKSRNGGVNYFLNLRINLKQGWDDVRLYLELTSKPNFEVLGYPELLLEKPLILYKNYHNLNYAKYADNKLQVRTGNFPYAFERSIYKFAHTEFAFFKTEGFDHLLYNADEKNTVIVSFPTIRFHHVLISFTYIYFFFFILTILLLIIGNRFTPIVNFTWSIKNKIVYSMILILLISLVFVGGGTIFYTYRQFEKGQNTMLSEKLQSILVEIETKLATYKSIDQISPDYLNYLLLKFSNVFYTDINLYDLKGNLVATSRNEIFERQLTSTKMNAEAYRELVINKKARIVHKEDIGNLHYYSGYVPFISSDGRLLAYLNLPYFSKESAFRQELLGVVVAVINIYAFLIILSIVIAFYMSGKITEPLRVLQQRISNIDLRKENERVEYKGKDEIAELVYEYNRMLEELDNSTQLLAKSARESAWREMAKQIAHEIKNPLTPMKLNIQLLELSWKNKDSDFNERFNRFTGNLIEQINSLSSIASAFSQFAQMPKARSEKVDIKDRIIQSAQLYKECTFAHVTYNFNHKEAIYVKADNERMLQVFNNLIKNAIQSIPRNGQGIISIHLTQSEQSVVVEVKDNGTGIDPEMANKLFQPNFTTKSSGTGLGLAIVKNIVEEFGGAIWFQSEANQGTSFFVSLPLYNDEV